MLVYHLHSRTNLCHKPNSISNLLKSWSQNICISDAHEPPLWSIKKFSHKDVIFLDQDILALHLSPNFKIVATIFRRMKNEIMTFAPSICPDKIFFVRVKIRFVQDKIILSRTKIILSSTKNILSWTKNILSGQMDRA